MDRADQIMLEMGFPETERGPYSTELRALVCRQVSEGLRRRSAGTWARDDIPCEERAKAFLAVEWEFAHGHAHEVKAIGGFAWDNIPAWIGDRLRELRFHWRKWQNRKLINPYA